MYLNINVYRGYAARKAKTTYYNLKKSVNYRFCDLSVSRQSKYFNGYVIHQVVKRVGSNFMPLLRMYQYSI